MIGIVGSLVFVCLLCGTAQSAQLWDWGPDNPIEDNLIESTHFRRNSKKGLIPSTLVTPELIDNEPIGEPLNPSEKAAAILEDPNPKPIDPNARKLDDPNFYEGDIALTQKELDQLNQNIMMDNPPARAQAQQLERVWPNGIIPYSISGTFSAAERLVITKAIRSFEDKTCIQFRSRTDERDYLWISATGGCSSYVGRKGGKQPVQLGPGCVHEGIVSHELMHASGFWHEHSRPDRDKYIDIIKSNILKNMEHNFYAKTWNEVKDFSVGYDEGSVMHYRENAFAINRNMPTIVSRRNKKIGQREGLSPKDILKLNALYECGKTKTTPPTTTTSGKCVDNNKNCAKWAAMGECKKNIWMKPNCPLSCKICGQCEDTTPECTTYAKNGDCANYPSYMLSHCKKSCGVCGSTSTTSTSVGCVDKNVHCPAWAKRDECWINPRFMHKDCKKSCGKC